MRQRNLGHWEIAPHPAGPATPGEVRQRRERKREDCGGKVSEYAEREKPHSAKR